MLKTLLFIGMGSFTGGVLRYLISRYVQNFLTPSFPLGTLLVNVLGCFAIGLFYGLFERGNLMNPIALVGAAACRTPEDFVTIAQTLDRAAKEVGVNFLGGYSALVSKGMTTADELLIRSIPQALAVTDFVCSSINLGSTKTGINMDAVKLMGEIIKKTAEASKENNCLGCAKLVVFCNAPDDNPFMAGAFHGVTEADAIINVGVSGPGVVKHALEKVRGENFEVLCETIKKTAFKVTRVGQLVAQEASKRLNIPFGIIDLSLAPTPAIGDSVADILEEIGLEHAGAPGTTAALALLNDQVIDEKCNEQNLHNINQFNLFWQFIYVPLLAGRLPYFCHKSEDRMHPASVGFSCRYRENVFLLSLLIRILPYLCTE